LGIACPEPLADFERLLLNLQDEAKVLAAGRRLVCDGKLPEVEALLAAWGVVEVQTRGMVKDAGLWHVVRGVQWHLLGPARECAGRVTDLAKVVVDLRELWMADRRSRSRRGGIGVTRIAVTSAGPKAARSPARCDARLETLGNDCELVTNAQAPAGAGENHRQRKEDEWCGREHLTEWLKRFAGALRIIENHGTFVGGVAVITLDGCVYWVDADGIWWALGGQKVATATMFAVCDGGLLARRIMTMPAPSPPVRPVRPVVSKAARGRGLFQRGGLARGGQASVPASAPVAETAPESFSPEQLLIGGTDGLGLVRLLSPGPDGKFEQRGLAMTLGLLRACEDSEERPTASARDNLSQENRSGSLGFWFTTAGDRKAVMRPLREYASGMVALVKRPLADEPLISDSLLAHPPARSEDPGDDGNRARLEVSPFTLESLVGLDAVRANGLQGNHVPEEAGDLADVSGISARSLFLRVAEQLAVPVVASARLLLPGRVPRGVVANSANSRRLFALPVMPPLSAAIELAFRGLLLVYGPRTTGMMQSLRRRRSC
jgi:hypothetical protein